MTVEALEAKRELAFALKRQHRQTLDECFDPMKPASRPTPIQLQILQETKDVLYQFIQGGNQCKPLYSLVLMADGSRKQINQVVVGDRVMSFDTTLQKMVPTTVVKTWHNGVKPVHRYWTNEHTWTDSTPNHEMVNILGSRMYKRAAEKSTNFITPCGLIEGEDHPEGIPPNGIELLGYLLGDGCLVWTHKDHARSSKLQFTNKNPEIIAHIRSRLPPDYSLNQYTEGSDYFIVKTKGVKGGNAYTNWIRNIGLAGTRAGTKFIPECVYIASADTRAKFVAGMVATDGWVSAGAVGFCSTSEQLARGMRQILLSLGIYSTLKRSSRKNKAHAALWSVDVRRPQFVKIFHDRIRIPGKPPKAAPTDRLDRKNKKTTWASSNVKKTAYIGDMDVYDITVDHPDHNYVCDGYITGNSGKTSVVARCYSWMFKGHHPYWDLKEAFGDEPLLMLLVGRLNNQVEEIWQRKIKPFLTAPEYRENRQGGTLQFAWNPKNDHKIVFATHNNPIEAREKLQSYSAHAAWLDELTAHLGIIEELQRRVQAKRGRMFISYTPKLLAKAVKQFIETPTPYSKIYRINMLDNPLYADRREEVLSQIEKLPQAQRDTILFGDWYVGEQAVYSFDAAQHVELPPNYSTLWPHVVSVDPAASGLMGYTLWAAPYPNAHRWWCVDAQYIKGAAPTDLITGIEKKIKDYNVLFKVCDTHESWYIKEAAKLGVHYRVVPNKRERKKELITAFNQALANGRVRLTPQAEDLGSELNSAQWSETTDDRIVNASSYHLADTAQYFVDQMPRYKESDVVAMTFDQELKLANQRRLANEAARSARSKGARTSFRIVARRGQVWRR